MIYCVGNTHWFDKLEPDEHVHFVDVTDSMVEPVVLHASSHLSIISSLMSQLEYDVQKTIVAQIKNDTLIMTDATDFIKTMSSSFLELNLIPCFVYILIIISRWECLQLLRYFM